MALVNSEHYFISSSITANTSSREEVDFFELLPTSTETLVPSFVRQIREFFTSSYDYIAINRALYATSSFIPCSSPLLFDDDETRILIGQPLTLQCEVSSPTTDDIIVSWTKDNIQVQQSANILFDNTKLIINSVTEFDSGTYTCIISNKNGIVYSDEFIVTVIDPRFNTFFYRNLIKNNSGQLGSAFWNDSDVGIISKDYNTKSFLSEPIPHDYDFCYSKSGFNTLSDLANSPILIQNISSSQVQVTDQFDPQFFIEDSGVSSSISASTIFDYEGSQYKEYANFFPNPYVLERTSVGQSIATQLHNELGAFYLSRPIIKYFREGDSIYASSFQDIDLSDNIDFINGTIFGINSINVFGFAYTGIGVSRILNVHDAVSVEFDEEGTIDFLFLDKNSNILDYAQTMSTPNPSEFMSYVKQNIDLVRLRGASIVLGRQFILPQIPNFTSKIRVRLTTKYLNNNQSDDSIQFNRSDIHLGNSFNDTIFEYTKPYGLSRVLFTGLQLRLFPNNSAYNNTLI